MKAIIAINNQTGEIRSGQTDGLEDYEYYILKFGDISDISKAALIDFAKQHDIKNANAIINRVAGAIPKFGAYAEWCHITQPWRSIIQKTLNDNLISFGYIAKDNGTGKSLRDMHGRRIANFSVLINFKGHYKWLR